MKNIFKKELKKSVDISKLFLKDEKDTDGLIAVKKSTTGRTIRVSSNNQVSRLQS